MLDQYREQVKNTALDMLRKCQLSFDSMMYILGSEYQAGQGCKVIEQYDIFNKIDKFRSFLKYYRRDTILDFTETCVFEECVEKCQEIIAELELYNEYLFGEKELVKEIDFSSFAQQVGYVYAPYVPVYGIPPANPQPSLPHVNVNISTAQIQAKTRKLTTRWSKEALQDLQNAGFIDDLPVTSDIILIPWTNA